MNSTVKNGYPRLLFWLVLSLSVISVSADNGNVLNKEISLTKDKGTIYEMLKHVSDISGYLFIYDSQIVDNNKKVKIRKGKYTIREAIYIITGNNKLSINVLGKHILLRLPHKAYNQKPEIKGVTKDSVESNYFTLKGILYDRITNDPVIYGSVSVFNTTIGTVSNLDGEFQLILPDSLLHSTIKFSHIGYQTQELEAALLSGQDIRLSLEPQIISLQEIVVRIVNPLEVLTKTIEFREQNYSTKPVNMTVFYREGIEHKKNNINLTEGVLELYKTGVNKSSEYDQAKLIKMRRIISLQEKDSILPKMKSGVNSCLWLDVMKTIPDFMEIDKLELPYEYMHSDISVIDGRQVNVISFEPQKHVRELLYKGQLFIDVDNFALVEARFEIDPKYVNGVTKQFVERKSKGIEVTLQQAKYVVSYRPSDNSIYYMNHIRVDLRFKVKNKKRLFGGSSDLHIWIDMVNCKTDIDDVESFSRKERLSSNIVFSEIKHVHDPNFWDKFNIILPEDKLRELILNSLSEIAEE